MYAWWLASLRKQPTLPSGGTQGQRQGQGQGQDKRGGPPHQVCDCFGHTTEGLREEEAKLDLTATVAAVQAEIQFGAWPWKPQTQEVNGALRTWPEPCCRLPGQPVGEEEAQVQAQVTAQGRRGHENLLRHSLHPGRGVR